MTGDRDNLPLVEGGGYAPPFSIRFSLSERAQLGRDAGPLTLSDYIRRCLFDNPDARKKVYKRPVQDDEALSQVLLALGQSRLAQNVNQLAKAAHSGSLPVTAETEQALQDACAAMQQMRQSLMRALGHVPKPAPQTGAVRPEDGGGP